MKKFNNTIEYIDYIRTVAETSLKEKTFDGTNSGDILKKNVDSEFMPRFHVTPLGGLINDPNGLHEIDGTYYIYYQLSPFVSAHFSKHWGLVTTTDFINYKDEGIKLSPVDSFDKDGCYSGAAIVDEGKAKIFYTGNLKHESGLEENFSATTVYWDKETEEKKFLFEVDKNEYTRHFRDPVPYIKDDKKYLIHAAQKRNIEGTMSIYESDHWDKDWKMKGNMSIDNLYDPGYMLECPTMVKLGEKELFGFLVQGSKQFPEMPTVDVAVAAVGNWNIEENRFENNGLIPLDYGPDYYAPQMFNDSKGNTISIAWIGSGNTLEYIDANDGYNGMLTLPRSVMLVKDKLKQMPVEQIMNLDKEIINDLNGINNKKIWIEDNEVSFNSISIENELGHSISIEYNKNEFKLDRRNSTKQEERTILKDKTTLENEFNVKFDNEGLEKILIIIDHSVIEVFMNDGEKTFTARIYLSGNWSIKTKNNTVSIYSINI